MIISENRQIWLLICKPTNALIISRQGSHSDDNRNTFDKMNDFAQVILHLPANIGTCILLAKRDLVKMVLGWNGYILTILTQNCNFSVKLDKF
jgi:hypothetical protein